MNKIIVHIIFIIVLTGCLINQKTSTVKNTSPKIEEKKFVPNLSIFHNSKDTTTFYISVSSNDLLYLRSSLGEDFKAKMKVNYKIYTVENKIPIDTGSFMIQDMGLDKNITLIAQKKIKLNSNSNYQAEFKCKDVNRDEIVILEQFINKKDEFTRQHFLILKENLHPIVENSTNEKKIWLAHPSFANQSLWVRYYNRDFKVPSPPFSSNKIEKFSYKADSVFKIHLNDSGFVKLGLNNKGFYHFQRDSSNKEGFTLFIFPGGFPQITKAEQLIEPIRYLTSNAEYEVIYSSKNKKVEIDNFWINKCGSKERAREIIRQFYGRVEMANKKYTSYIEGWKTDRGMIAIIFGEPHSITKSQDSETWYYNNDRAYSYITFTFLKVTNPFTDNDYMLTRDTEFKPQWYRAVESWRQGRVYSANNF